MVGTQARILYADAEGRTEIARRFNRMVRDGEIVVRKMTNLSITLDHRIVAGMKLPTIRGSRMLRWLALLLAACGGGSGVLDPEDIEMLEAFMRHS